MISSQILRKMSLSSILSVSGVNRFIKLSFWVGKVLNEQLQTEEGQGGGGRTQNILETETVGAGK